MKVCVSGFTGVGKTTVAEEVAKIIKAPHIAFTMKDEAKRRGMTIVELQDIAAKDKSIDLEFDERQKEELGKHASFVTSTWLGAWLADADINVWLYASEDVRVSRVAKRDKLPVEDARKMMLRKDEQNVERYLKLYNINIADVNKFHVCINTEFMAPPQAALAIVRCLEAMKR